ncbi:hypothetical protein [Breoghania corrubedonensis]|uniref:sunset domain-containing protein n=1 Tax=Breoghania corrubedonensis TaxID=665038 RepID=UPI001AEC770E
MALAALFPATAFAACKPPEKPAPPGCRIKGNINSDGARIYHVPGKSRWYSRTCINRPGERWFCSEEEARAAGWRAPRR